LKVEKEFPDKIFQKEKKRRKLTKVTECYKILDTDIFNEQIN
jgi:hypothetical protein